MTEPRKNHTGQEVETQPDRKWRPSRTGSGGQAGQEMETQQDRKCCDDVLLKALQTTSVVGFFQVT